MRMTLHHVALASPHTADAARFYTEIWGLREVANEDGIIRLGATSDADGDYSLVLVTSDRKAVDHFCLVTETESDFAWIRDSIRENDIRIVSDATPSPGLTDAVSIIDLDGRRVEIGYKPDASAHRYDVADEMASAPKFPAHIVLNTKDIAATTAWYEKHLGMGVREWRAKKMSFLYANEDHHTVAFNSAPHVSLNHVAWELGDINQFFRAIGRAGAGEFGEKIYGPGRHGPGDYIFCYFLDPMGFVCEYETEGTKIANPEDFPFRVVEYSPESVDQWLGTLSGGTSPRFRKAALGEPDQGLTPATEHAI